MKNNNNTSRPIQRQPSQRNMSGDERIVNRTNQRRKRNRRKKLIIRAVICMLFLCIGIILVLTMFFNINEITVTGDKVYSNDDIINTSGVIVGDNLIFISEKEIDEKISQNLPYVDSVNIKRHLPSGLEIQVKKTEAVYAVFIDGMYTLLNNEGKVLEKGLEFISENIILLNMGEIISADAGKNISLKNDKVMEKLELVNTACKECGMTGLTSIDFSDIYNIKAVYQGRITLELGEIDKNNVTKKIDLGKNAIEYQDEENAYYRGTINLTVEGKGYWSEETVTTEPHSDEMSGLDSDNQEATNADNTNEESSNVASEEPTSE